MENTKGLDNFINSTLGLGHGYLAKMLELEEERQERNIELIASENYASEAVRLAMASCLTNKYAEGIDFMAVVNIQIKQKIVASRLGKKYLILTIV